MVTLRTCSYQEFQPEMGTPIRASLGVPRWRVKYQHDWQNLAAWEITPRRDYLYASDRVYTERFTAQMETAGVDGLRERFDTLAKVAESLGYGTGPLVFLCFENLRKKGPESCHRRLFARWWQTRTGETVEEMGEYPSTASRNDAALSLDRPARLGTITDVNGVQLALF